MNEAPQAPLLPEPPVDPVAASDAAAALPLPGSLGSLRPPALNLALFGLTFASAFLAGAWLTDTQLPEATQPEMIRHGLAFSAALLAIMLSHEMGHFLWARHHKVDATWPFFIPAPLLSLIGTLGAVIKLRSLPRTRGALIDIGAWGPLAGFLVTLPVLAIGLKLSTVVPLEPESPHWSLFESFLHYLREGRALPLKQSFELGAPLGMDLVQRLVIGPLPAGQTLALHPVAVAGWFGFFLTALNLLPLGQLDGGHLLFGFSPRLHRLLGAPLAAALLAMGVFTPFVGWALWGLLMGLGLGHHPNLAAPESKLDTRRKLLLVASLVAFALSFTPVPLATLSG